jgi:hypothetical protein
MTSQINASTIDATYPVAGQDNDSQGFRDNFTKIKLALSTASVEISDLQKNTAKINTASDFDGNLIQNAIFQNVGNYAINDIEINNTTHDYTVYYNSAAYYDITINTSTAITVANWPATGVYSPIRVGVKLGAATTSTTATTCTFLVDLGGTIMRERGTRLPFQLGTLTNVTTVFDLYTTDAGNNVFVRFIGTFTQA